MGFFKFQQPQEEDEGLGPPPGPFQFRRRGNINVPGGLMRWAVALVVILVIFIVASIAKGIYANWLWFDSVPNDASADYLSVFRLRIVTRIWLFFAGAGIFLAFFGINILIAIRYAFRGVTVLPQALGDVEPAAARRIAIVVAVAASLFLAVIFGATAAGQWDSILLLLNSQSFGQEDPAFNRDIGFYVFQLPALNFIVGWSMGAAVITTIVVGALYASRLLLGGTNVDAPPLARPHISLLLILVVGLFISRYWLGRFELVYSERGAAFGAAYTDINAQLPVIYILMALGTLTAVLIFVSIFRRQLLFLPIGATALWVVVAIVGGLIYPATVQRFQVEPNELAQEREFIQRNIDATRAAYGLDQIEEQPFPARESVTAEEILANPETIQNIRLWDSRPLRDTFNQLQALGPLYNFLPGGVDVDRYEIDGELRQVMLAARELDQTSLEQKNQSWVNRRLNLTHGFGLAMVPVNEVAGQGLPEFFIENIPPTSKFDGFNIEQPRIYFGEIPASYVIVNADEDEFDFPVGEDQRAQNRFDGEGGVELSSLLRRFVYAWEFGDTDILISDALNDESRLLYRRNIRERVETIAPFLALDSDPYLVVAEGQLFWIQDAYTHTDRYPYSTRNGELNYIRNSVKVVINAFDGSTTFYLVDENDPIAQVYQGIYPDLFTDFDEMPETLRAHVRYPEDLFQIQAQQYLRYHIRNADDFFIGEDFWAIPTEKFFDQEQLLEPYFVIMKLPGEEKEEFVLIMPFRPRGERKNSIAWLAARSDGENLGKLLVFRFTETTVVLGPSQVESRIDQDTTVSRQLSLWDQAGSQVIRGNLLMIPIGESFLFVEPIYLQSTASRFPELKRVVVVTGRNDPVIMEETLEQALAVALGRAEPSEPILDGPDGEPPTVEPTPAPGETPAATSTPRPTTPLSDDVGDLIEQANDSFVRAQQLLQQGDFAGYGEEIAELQLILQRLMELSGGG